MVAMFTPRILDKRTCMYITQAAKDVDGARAHRPALILLALRLLALLAVLVLAALVCTPPALPTCPALPPPRLLQATLQFPGRREHKADLHNTWRAHTHTVPSRTSTRTHHISSSRIQPAPNGA